MKKLEQPSNKALFTVLVAHIPKKTAEGDSCSGNQASRNTVTLLYYVLCVPYKRETMLNLHAKFLKLLLEGKESIHQLGY